MPRCPLDAAAKLDDPATLHGSRLELLKEYPKPIGLGQVDAAQPQPWMRLQADRDLHQAMRREPRKAS